MEICVESFDGEKYTVEVGVDDTTADIRRKVATAAELCEDGFDMSFGGKLLAEGDYITQLSAGDTIVLKNNSQKYNAIAALRDLGETRLTSERFEGLEDLKLVHLFLQAEVVTEIPNSFFKPGGRLNGCLVDLSGVSGVTTIRNDVFSKCRSLHTVDLSGWSNLTHVGNNFLFNCKSLTRLDLSGWSNVTHVGINFLFNCGSLRTLDLSSWTNVTHVGCEFLKYCRALTTLDLSGWTNVTHLGSGFITECSALRTADLSGWNKVTTIPNDFFSECDELTTLDLSGWSNVTSILYEFLSNCKSLTRLDLSGWNNVRYIHSGFLKGCKIRTKGVNVTGSSSVVSEYVVHSRDVEMVECKCVCM